MISQSKLLATIPQELPRIKIDEEKIYEWKIVIFPYFLYFLSVNNMKLS